MTELMQIKLINNDELIGYVRPNNSDGLIIKNPLLISRIQNERGEIFFTMKSWFLNQYEESKDVFIEIKKDKVLARNVVGDSVSSQYQSTLNYLKNDIIPDEQDYDLSNVKFDNKLN